MPHLKMLDVCCDFCSHSFTPRFSDLQDAQRPRRSRRLPFRRRPIRRVVRPIRRVRLPRRRVGRPIRRVGRPMRRVGRPMRRVGRPIRRVGRPISRVRLARFRRPFRLRPRIFPRFRSG